MISSNPLTPEGWIHELCYNAHLDHLGSSHLDHLSLCLLTSHIVVFLYVCVSSSSRAFPPSPVDQPSLSPFHSISAHLSLPPYTFWWLYLWLIGFWFWRFSHFNFTSSLDGHSTTSKWLTNASCVQLGIRTSTRQSLNDTLFILVS